jgi:hypothetical protein
MDEQENSGSIAEVHDVTFQLASTMGVARRGDETLEEAFEREITEGMSDERLKTLFRKGAVSYSEPSLDDGETVVQAHGDVEEIVGTGLPDGAVAIDRADHVDENPRVLVAVDSRADIRVVHEEQTHKIVALTPTAQGEQSTGGSGEVGQADD